MSEKMSLQALKDETNDLLEDYADFLEHLAELGNDEVPTLAEFARWRQQEFYARDEWFNPIPPVH